MASILLCAAVLVLVPPLRSSRVDPVSARAARARLKAMPYSPTRRWKNTHRYSGHKAAINDRFLSEGFLYPRWNPRLSIRAAGSSEQLGNGIDGYGNEGTARSAFNDSTTHAGPKRAVVKWYDPAKNFGFVMLEDTLSDAFFHVCHCDESVAKSSLARGLRVTVTVKWNVTKHKYTVSRLWQQPNNAEGDVRPCEGEEREDYYQPSRTIDRALEVNRMSRISRDLESLHSVLGNPREQPDKWTRAAQQVLAMGNAFSLEGSVRNAQALEEPCHLRRDPPEISRSVEGNRELQMVFLSPSEEDPPQALQRQMNLQMTITTELLVGGGHRQGERMGRRRGGEGRRWRRAQQQQWQEVPFIPTGKGIEGARQPNKYHGGVCENGQGAREGAFILFILLSPVELWVTSLRPGAERLGDSLKIPGKFAIVMGSENAGISDEMLEAADKAVYLQTHGFVESLNVGVATALVLAKIFSLCPEARGDLTGPEKELTMAQWKENGVVGDVKDDDAQHDT
eukprot:jgi/Bigna1/84094/fgenesh1_pg.122_\